MTRLFVIVSRIRALFGRDRLDADFAEEMGSHLEMLARAHERRGLSPDDAMRAARLEFGGPMQTVEARREQRGLAFVDTTLQDVRYGLRALRRSPVYAATAIATLAIGIGAGTAMFTLARAALLRPLPYSAPGRLVRIFETNPLKNWTRNIAAPANYADWRRQNTVFTDIAAYEQFDSVGSGATDVFLTGRGEPQPLKALGVTGNLFTVLGTAPLLGRVFTDAETYEGHGRVAILSYGAWQSIFGGDPAVVGRTIALSGRNTDIVGVMPREFFFPGRDVQIWLAVAYDPAVFVKSRRPHWLGVVARLRAEVTLAQAQQEMSTIARALERQYPDTNTQMGVRLENLHDSFAYAPRPALLMLSGAVGLFFLLVCANIANLQLGRAAGRLRELAVRRALGAARGRLVRQLFTESLVISIVGGGIGVALAFALRAALLRMAASAIPVYAEVRFDAPVLLFAGVLTLVAPALFGVLPALRSSAASRVNERIEAGSREDSGLRTLLIATEVALSVVLVAAAILLVRSMSRLQAVDPGFDPDGAVALTVTLPSARYPDAQSRLGAFEEVERRLRAEPAVQAAGATSTLALRGYTWTGDATVEGRSADDYERELRHKSVTPGYFGAMRIRLIAGRLLDDGDAPGKPPVAVVNQSLARAYFRGSNALGRRIAYGRPQDHAPWVTIVGIVADEQQDALDKAAQPAVYSPIRQQMQNPMTFVVRSTLDASAVVAAARRDVHAVDPDVALTSITSLRGLVDDSLGDHRLQTALFVSFAAVALFVAALGIYGVLAYFVTQRSRELGIRLALGAPPRELFAMVVRQGMRPAIAGGATGVAAALALTRLMASLLFGVTPLDPVTYGSTAGILGVAALLACALPAARATRVDPLTALKDE